jgi:hypothetical protein
MGKTHGKTHTVERRAESDDSNHLSTDTYSEKMRNLIVPASVSFQYRFVIPFTMMHWSAELADPHWDRGYHPPTQP